MYRYALRQRFSRIPGCGLDALNLTSLRSSCLASAVFGLGLTIVRMRCCVSSNGHGAAVWRCGPIECLLCRWSLGFHDSQAHCEVLWERLLLSLAINLIVVYISLRLNYWRRISPWPWVIVGSVACI